MEEVTPNIAESKYIPLNLEEFYYLKAILDSIVSYMPEQHAPFIWSSFNKVRGVEENRPCTCASSGGHWGRAIAHLREWVKSKE
jgi:hypothetical protein